MKVRAPHGSWPARLEAAALASGSRRYGHLQVTGSTVWWSESRPDDGGRSALVAAEARTGARRDATPPGFDVRSRVHEYGGAAFCIAADGSAWAVHDGDGRIHRLPAAGDASGGASHAARHSHVSLAVLGQAGMRYADLVADVPRGRLVAVREDHTGDGEAKAALVALDWTSGREAVLAAGHDFCSDPRLSPDGRRLAWLTWDHPRMPWQGSELWVAELDADGAPDTPRRVAGGPRESIAQPAWSPAGELHFASDASGWWNLHRQRSRDGGIEALWPVEAEFARPLWQLGQAMYDFEPAGDAIVCAYVQDGHACLARLTPGDEGSAPRRLDVLDTPLSGFHHVRAGDGFVACFGSASHQVESVLAIDLASGEARVLAASSDLAWAPADVSVAEPFVFAGSGGRPTHAFHYPPASATHEGEPGALPPLVVMSHGGPTGMTDAGLRPSIQYYTQRGFAVADVNYGGSSGYGRAYRERLDGRWGEVDVDDVVAAARHLVDTGRVDGARLCIRGASAGGYTTLAALAFRPGVFRAGASHYGIGELSALARDTHKFESRYLDSLVGPWPAAEAIYRARSPVFHLDRLASALILFQGDEDKVVPPAQSQAMHEAVRAKGLPVAYLVFRGEQHGFRQAVHIRRALECELAFYGRVLGFTPADAPDIDFTIDNLPPSRRPPPTTTAGDRP